MGFLRIGLVYLFLAMVVVAESINHSNYVRYNCIPGLDGCEYEPNEEYLMDSEINRRQLAAQKHISYGALKANSVPCNNRGSSYYNCKAAKKANPYNRGCSAITKCKRYTN